jgi:hypothetical protein
MIKVWRRKKNLETGEKGGERRLTGYLYRLSAAASVLEEKGRVIRKRTSSGFVP